MKRYIWPAPRCKQCGRLQEIHSGILEGRMWVTCDVCLQPSKAGRLGYNVNSWYDPIGEETVEIKRYTGFEWENHPNLH